MPRLSPADAVLADFGIRPLARILEVDPTTVIRWRNGDGLIPSQYHRRLLEIAKELNVKLTTDDLIHGRLVR